MKKLVILLAALGTLSFASCKKDYTCVCVDGTDTESFPIADKTKSEAKSACNSLGVLWTPGTCSLK
ncbi:MAG: hypothetical protein WC716_09490 [Chitinophagaceae bacterium]